MPEPGTVFALPAAGWGPAHRAGAVGPVHAVRRELPAEEDERGRSCGAGYGGLPSGCTAPRRRPRAASRSSKGYVRGRTIGPRR